MSGIDVTPWFVLLTTIDLTFSEKFVNFKFAFIFNSFSRGIDEKQA